MNLSAPSQSAFVIAVLLAVVALLVFFRVLPIAGVPAFWLMSSAFLVLFLGNVLKGL